MDKEKWKRRLKIDKDADVLFYQNPKFFRSNTFKREYLEKDLDDLIKKAGKVKIYTISAVANNSHKLSGQRIKVCLVKEFH